MMEIIKAYMVCKLYICECSVSLLNLTGTLRKGYSKKSLNISSDDDDDLLLNILIFSNSMASISFTPWSLN